MHTKALTTSNSPFHPDKLVTTSPEASLEEALAVMHRNRIHHLPVIRAGELVGMLAEREVATYLLQRTTSPTGAMVERCMRRDVPVISETTEIRAALRLMLDSGFSALPVLREGKLAGIVTETDMLRLLDGLLQKGGTLDAVVNRGEELLAHPVVQSLMKILGDAGI